MSDSKTQRRDYVPPKIVHTEKLTARASSCSKADGSCATGGQTGPLQS